MKIVTTYIKEEWFKQNAMISKYRDSKSNDIWKTARSLFVSGFFGIVGGLGRARPETVESSFHALKGALHELAKIPGYGGFGKADMNFGFFDSHTKSEHKEGKRRAQSSQVNPYYYCHIVTEDNFVETGEITSGIVFVSKEAAEEFLSMYDSYEKFKQSKFYMEKEHGYQSAQERERERGREMKEIKKPSFRVPEEKMKTARAAGQSVKVNKSEFEFLDEPEASTSSTGKSEKEQEKGKEPASPRPGRQ